MIKPIPFYMKRVLKLLPISAVLAVIASPCSFAQSADISRARVAAIRECNVRASPYKSYTWGDWELYIYRACMAEHGQKE